jgi:hypothetical protein
MGIDHRAKVKDRPAIVGGTDQLQQFSGFTTPTGLGLTCFKVIDPDVVFSHAHTTGEDILML